MVQKERLPELEQIVGWKIVRAVKQAKAHIEKTKFCNKFPEDFVKKRFGVDMKTLPLKD